MKVWFELSNQVILTKFGLSERVWVDRDSSKDPFMLFYSLKFMWFLITSVVPKRVSKLVSSILIKPKYKLLDKLTSTQFDVGKPCNG